NGLWLSPTGILAKKAGVNTFTVTDEGDVALIGTITASAGSIGGWSISATALYYDGSTDALSAGMASADYPFYAGKKYADRATAPFRVTPAGAVVASDITITGGSASGILLSSLSAGSELAIQGWQFSGTFSATDYNTVAWTSGTIILMDGTTFSITAGNTGNMAALTYIYFSKTASTTVLQTTTTASTAVGSNKILMAVAQNNTDTSSKATFQVFGGTGGQLLTVDNIAANSASTNEFISNTAQIKDAIITSAKIADLEASKITVVGGKLSDSQINSATTWNAKLDSGDVGDMAFEDLVESAKLGTTIVQGGYIKTSLLNVNDIFSQNITASGTITGPTLQTAATGSRIKIHHDGSISGTIDFLYNSSLYGRLHPYAGGSGSGIAMETEGGYVGKSGVVIYEGISLGSAGLMVGGSVQLEANSTGNWSATNFKPTSSGKDLGGSASANKWQDLYLSRTAYINDIDLDGSITMDANETVDGVDISAHAGSASAHHNYLSDNLSITPANVDIKADGYIKRAGSPVARLTSLGFDMYVPLGLRQLSSPPGSASTYEGFIYFDTTQEDLVFSNGTNWYKVTATAI
ncbi:MAG: hypothetical protein PHI16_06535, partial [Methanocellales archaeon]|nr:hypothetical protein [Methanocellales archaeon]